MYIARQPIFDRNLKVYGYELLYRSTNTSNRFDGLSCKGATGAVINALYELGLKEIIDEKKAFINFGEEILLSEIPELISSANLIIEVLETVNDTKEMYLRLKELRERGYWIALDDFEKDYNEFSLLDHANIIKYDIRLTPLDTIKEDVERALKEKKILLAEKLETNEEFYQAKEMGFQLFQGYFFSKPYIVGKNETKNSNAFQYAMILSELSKEESSFQRLAEIFESNTALAYKVMKLAGKKTFTSDIYSVKKALTYIGTRDLKLWISVLMVQDCGNNKPPELLKLSLIRSKFGELIIRRTTSKQFALESAMMGLFSTLDAIMDQPMEELLKDMPFTEDVKNALLNQSGLLGGLYNFIIAYENAEWEYVNTILAKYNIDEEKIFNCYLEAIKWANEILDSIND